MKRKRAFAALLTAAVVWTTRLTAQDPVAEAHRQEAEERYRSLNKRQELLEESIAAHQKSVQALTDEVRKLKDEIDRLRNKNESAATQDSLKRLQDAILEVDKKRVADYERVTRQFEELRKLMLDKLVPGGSSRPPTAPTDSTANPGGTRQPAGGPTAPSGNKGYKYAIRSGDTLSALVKALRKEGHKVTEKIIMDANPGVNWNRLRVGQEIFIPETR